MTIFLIVMIVMMTCALVAIYGLGVKNLALKEDLSRYDDWVEEFESENDQLKQQIKDLIQAVELLDSSASKYEKNTDEIFDIVEDALDCSREAYQKLVLGFDEQDKELQRYREEYGCLTPPS